MPNQPVIDAQHCLMLTKGRCGVCAKVCPREAINFKDADELVKVKAGAIVLATGFELWDHSAYGEYGAGRIADVIDGFAFERLASASGPTERRNPPAQRRRRRRRRSCSCSAAAAATKRRARKYCSKICCMYTAKHAMLYAHKVHGGRAVVFYMDVRAAGKGYDEFVRRAIEKDGAEYVRGRVSKIYRRADGKIIVRGADTLAGTPVTIEADMVVLADAVVPRTDAQKLAQMLGVAYDADGFFSEAHPKLRPVETAVAGVYPGRRLPGAEGHPGVGRAGLRRRRQGAGPLRPAETGARADRRPREPHHLRALPRVHQRLPVQGHRGLQHPGPERQSRCAPCQRQRRAVPGLRHVRVGLPVEEHGSRRLHRRAGLLCRSRRWNRRSLRCRRGVHA